MIVLICVSETTIRVLYSYLATEGLTPNEGLFEPRRNVTLDIKGPLRAVKKARSFQVHDPPLKLYLQNKTKNYLPSKLLTSYLFFSVYIYLFCVNVVIVTVFI